VYKKHRAAAVKSCIYYSCVAEWLGKWID